MPPPWRRFYVSLYVRLNSFLKKYLSQLPIGLLVVLVLFAGALFLFAYTVHEVFAEHEKSFDQAAFQWISYHLTSPRLTPFMKGVTYFASAPFLQIAYGLVLLFYFFRKKLKRVAEIFAVGFGGFLLNYFMKLFFHRLRPSHPLIGPLHNFSFPSGHATSGFIFYGLLSYLLWKTSISKRAKFAVISFLVLFSLLIGFSRVYLRVHYASDVVAGFCNGFAWLAVTISLFEYLKKKVRKEQAQESASQDMSRKFIA